MRIGYLSSHYPAVSHVFTLREVRALRSTGMDLQTLSIHAAPDDQILSAADREAAATTVSVLPTTAGRILSAHMRSFIASPRRYMSTLLRSWTLSPPGSRDRLWQLFYFAEAMLVYDACVKLDVRHLHAQFADVATDVALLVSHRGGPGWSWSVALHGPSEFANVRRARIPEKVADARFVQAISDFGRSQVLSNVPERYWHKVHVVRCGVDLDEYQPREPPATAEHLRLLCVGRLVPEKGQRVLLDALAKVRASGVDAHLSLIGDGPSRAALEEHARELGLLPYVTFHGSVGQDEIRDHYASADIFCLASFAEGLPVVLMEAMALERPVVTTRIMGIPELVDDGVNGLLVAPGSPDQLATAIGRLAGDAERRLAMGKAGRQKIAEEYDLQESAQALRRLFAAYVH
jgi:colanic acid/amylovoran biosynthesis glycosyltransferase